MAVSLGIRWDDGREEEFPLAPQRTAEEYLAPMARRLGLKHVPEWYSYYPIDREVLDEVYDEISVVRAEVVQDTSVENPLVRNLDRVMNALAGLRGTVDWEASVG